MRRLLPFLITVCSPLAFGQACDPPDPSIIVSYPSGTLIEGVGTSDLTITTKSEKCRALVKQGFALIHCFWFNEAVRSFRDATKEDPTCAIAWCGLNISETLPWNRGDQFSKEAEYAIKRAVALYESASGIEKALIAAFRVRDLTKDDRSGPFAKAIEGVIEEYRDAQEPRLLMAGIRAQVCMFDRTLPSGEVQNELKEVARLIAPVLAKSPRNPGANHYQIHAYEGSAPEKALASARMLGEIAPASAHMVHMPGHLYNVLGMWEDANNSFSKANAIGEAYAKEIGAKPGEADWNYGHNRDYWGVSLGEEGRLKESFALLTYGGRRSEILWRLSDWRALSDGLAKVGNSDETSYYRGLACAYMGEQSKAEDELVKLKESPDRDLGNVAGQVLKTRKLELEGIVKFKSGAQDEGLELLRQAVTAYGRIEYEEPPYYMRPPHETLGDMLIEANRTSEAVLAFESGLKVKRNAGTMYFGIAKSYEVAGERAKAIEAYKKFLDVWNKADADRPQVVHAKAYLAANQK